MTTRSYSDLSDSATTFDPEEQFDRDIEERMKGMDKVQVELAAEDYEALQSAINSPPQPNDKLVELMKGSQAVAEGMKGMSDWQPIETAPRDGTEILAWWPRSKAHSIVYWLDDRWVDQADSIEVSAPSHWMPLPAPPTSKGE